MKKAPSNDSWTICLTMNIAIKTMIAINAAAILRKEWSLIYLLFSCDNSFCSIQQKLYVKTKLIQLIFL